MEVLKGISMGSSRFGKVITRFLTWKDRVVSLIFSIPVKSVIRDGKTEVHYFSAVGPRMCVIERDLRVSAITGLFTIIHKHDAEGRVVKRIPIMRSISEIQDFTVGEKQIKAAVKRSDDLHGLKRGYVL
jgi:hypothetical protein